MIEARAFISSLDEARAILERQRAVFKGEYKIRDIIFAPTNDSKTLVDEFLRMRVYAKKIWPEKDVVVAIKRTELKSVGKDSETPLKQEFDTEEEARTYIQANLADEFEYVFEFERVGWQYDLGEDQVDLEDIEGFYSVEVKSPSEQGVRKLLEMLHLQEVIKGPSVLAIKSLLNR